MKAWRKNVVALAGAILFGVAASAAADPAPAAQDVARQGRMPDAGAMDGQA